MLSRKPFRSFMVPLMAAATMAAVLMVDGAAMQAQARGGGSNFMNGYGYQRRLEESRGLVTNRSGTVYVSPRPAPRPRHWRRHRH